MKRVALFPAILAMMICSSCSQNGAGSPVASATQEGKYLTQLKSRRDLLTQLVDQGVCVVFLYVPERSEDVELQVYGSTTMKDHSFKTHPGQIVFEQHLGPNGSVITNKQSPRCVGGWPYLFPIHDSGAQLVTPCNQPDPQSDGYAALVVLEQAGGCQG